MDKETNIFDIEDDDIVQELRDWAEIVKEAVARNIHVQVLNMNMCSEAADEIERLRNKVNQLQDVINKIINKPDISLPEAIVLQLKEEADLDH